MKRLFMVGILSFTMVLGSGSALAATNGVNGDVVKNGQSVTGASVSVQCSHGTKTYNRSDTTSSTGHYSVSFDTSQCVSGDALSVTATSGENSGHATGVMNASPGHPTSVNVTLPSSAVALPEFPPAVAALSFTAVSAAVLVFIRRQRKAVSA